jgi:hypothetical protein
MTIELAIEYIPKRMEELGYGNNYNIRFRHFVLQAKETQNIDADNQLFILIEANDAMSVKSDFGIYDLAALNVNELQYEHQGNMDITNYGNTTLHVRFIQIIPKKENHAGNK